MYLCANLVKIKLRKKGVYHAICKNQAGWDNNLEEEHQPGPSVLNKNSSNSERKSVNRKCNHPVA